MRTARRYSLVDWLLAYARRGRRAPASAGDEVRLHSHRALVGAMVLGDRHEEAPVAEATP
jgi:hypothetical protein